VAAAFVGAHCVRPYSARNIELPPFLRPSCDTRNACCFQNFIARLSCRQDLRIVRAMKWRIVIALMVFAFASDRAQGINIAEFTTADIGGYQVMAQSGAARCLEVNAFMNEMLRQYSKFFSNWSPKAGARVVVFDNVNDFKAYTRTATKLSSDHVTGYCHLKTDADGNTFYELVTYEHEWLWEVLAHEGFHQFIGYELGLQVPTWLNEGMAQYFETCYIKNGKFVAGEVNVPRLLAAQALIGHEMAISVGQLLEMDKPTFYANAQVAYPLSWALVYYLMNRDGGAYRSGNFKRYLQDLKGNRDEFVSFRKRFGADSAQWQDEFFRYILRLRPPTE
jgi:hypothetical protein